VGAYDPTTNQHCYRGGVYFDGNGNAIGGGYSSSTIWCLKIAANSKGIASVPEPSPLSLMALGTAGIAVLRRRRSQQIKDQ
ncbi:MAG: PEP-CTERM sorting domain-containing protein, partial [Candidatus Nitrosoglobus sp.]